MINTYLLASHNPILYAPAWEHALHCSYATFVIGSVMIVALLAISTFIAFHRHIPKKIYLITWYSSVVLVTILAIMTIVTKHQSINNGYRSNLGTEGVALYSDTPYTKVKTPYVDDWSLGMMHRMNARNEKRLPKEWKNDDILYDKIGPRPQKGNVRQYRNYIHRKMRWKKHNNKILAQKKNIASYKKYGKDNTFCPPHWYNYL